MFLLVACALASPAAQVPPPRIRAQQLVDEIRGRHPEITGLELAASRSQTGICTTIAATEVKEIGEKCDKDELTAIKTNQPFVEHKEDGFDITMPLHDASGAVIATVGMDFRLEPGKQQDAVVKQARQIAAEFEKAITTKSQLFEAVK
jgi:hypothetical protein